MTKKTKVDELLIDEIKEYLGTLPEAYIRHILTLVRQHDKSQRNDVIEECIEAVKSERVNEDEVMYENGLDNAMSAIEALKNQ